MMKTDDEIKRDVEDELRRDPDLDTKEIAPGVRKLEDRIVMQP